MIAVEVDILSGSMGKHTQRDWRSHPPSLFHDASDVWNVLEVSPTGESITALFI